MFTNKNPFSDTLWATIKSRLEPALKEPGPHYAVFDADGTLWPLDAGETFFRYQLAHSQLPTAEVDRWDHYWSMKVKDAPLSCLFLAQINKGYSISQVREWADACYREPARFPIHKSMHELVQWLLQNGVQVFIVTASIKWAVEPPARILGLKNENVIGIEVTEEDGLLTDKGVYPLTFGAGKAEVFLDFTKKVRPILAAGNTISDSYLIETASHVQLAISSDVPGEHTHASEMKLKELALEKGWITHSFYTSS